MAERVLVTTTSFQDTPGKHHDLLAEKGYELVRARGPLSEDEIHGLVGDVDGIICGDDAFTRKVLEKCLPKCRVLSKYGIGLDKVDVVAATELKIPVCFTPGVNHTTVAEHVFGMILSLIRQIPQQTGIIHGGGWKRMTGHEMWSKTMGVLGMGRIGKETAKRARAFGMEVIGYDVFWNDDTDYFAAEYGVTKAQSHEEVMKAADFLSLHMNLTPENTGLINAQRLTMMKPTAVIVNTARGPLVDEAAVAEALKAGKLGGYCADVYRNEPPEKGNPLIGLDNTVLTPHIGSRTYESVVRQATKCVLNMIAVLEGRPPLAQANRV
ncbi:MAG: phosphoglycerate dehydrogenase [Phycisphaerae bacterium]|nr:phosphoglycerate dehydrogenase [Phycisphaerae bacterium]